MRKYRTQPKHKPAILDLANTQLNQTIFNLSSSISYRAEQLELSLKYSCCKHSTTGCTYLLDCKWTS